MTGLIKAKPTSPGRRFVIKVDRSDLHKGKPCAALLAPLPAKGGRNNKGRITVRHQGGAHKRKYRIIDFKRNKEGIPARVERIEYDPNRTARLALLRYQDGEQRYIVAPQALRPGMTVLAASDAPIQPGNCLPIRQIPLGTSLHAVELKPGKGAQLARSAGAYVQLVAREIKYATIRLRSGEVRKLPLDCKATIGVVGNVKHNLRSLGKAGAARWRGIRPTVRGVAMNPVDHPHGGGEGKTSGGRHPVTPWGIPTKGFRTVRKKNSEKFIIQRRKK